MPNSSLSPGDHVFLGFLANGPATAYDLKKEMTASVNFFWSAAHSQVYQQATRLVRDGFVEERPVGDGRQRRMLSLTATGRAALEEWLRQPAASYRIFDESLAKLFFGSLADPAALVQTMDDQRRRHAELKGTFEDFAAALERVDWQGRPPFQLLAVRLGLRVEDAYLDWIDEVLDALGPRPGPITRPAQSRSKSTSKGA